MTDKQTNDVFFFFSKLFKHFYAKGDHFDVYVHLGKTGNNIYFSTFGIFGIHHKYEYKICQLKRGLLMGVRQQITCVVTFLALKACQRSCHWQSYPHATKATAVRGGEMCFDRK